MTNRRTFSSAKRSARCFPRYEDKHSRRGVRRADARRSRRACRRAALFRRRRIYRDGQPRDRAPLPGGRSVCRGGQRREARARGRRGRSLRRAHSGNAPSRTSRGRRPCAAAACAARGARRQRVSLRRAPRRCGKGGGEPAKRLPRPPYRGNGKWVYFR